MSKKFSSLQKIRNFQYFVRYGIEIIGSKVTEIPPEFPIDFHTFPNFWPQLQKS